MGEENGLPRQIGTILQRDLSREGSGNGHLRRNVEAVGVMETSDFCMRIKRKERVIISF